MDLPGAYAICISSISVLLLAISNWPAGKRVRRLSSTVTNKVAYSAVVKRHRVLGPWPLSSILIYTSYAAVNVLCLFCKFSFEATAKEDRVLSLAPLSEATSRAGRLSVVNLMPLYFSFHHSFIADMLGLSLAGYEKVHRVSGVASFGLFVFHSATTVGKGTQFDISSWLDIKKLIAASSFVLLVIASLLKIALPYELHLRLHQLVALVLIASIVDHIFSVPRFERIPMYVYGGIICSVNIAYSVRVLRRNTNLNLPWPRAFLKRLDGSIYMVIRVSRPLKVAAGQYINVWIPGVQFWSSHPYAISRYWWSEGRSNLEMLVEPHLGLSQKLWHSLAADEGTYVERRVFFTGPHGTRIPHERFNIVIMIAEGFGVLSMFTCLEEMARVFATSRTRHIRVVWMKRASDPSHILNLFNEALDKDSSAKRMKVLVHEDGRRSTENVGRVAILPGAPDFQKILTDPDAFHDPKKSYFAASEDHTKSKTLVLVSSGRRVRDKVKDVASASSNRITIREMDFQPIQGTAVSLNVPASGQPLESLTVERAATIDGRSGCVG